MPRKVFVRHIGETLKVSCQINSLPSLLFISEENPYSIPLAKNVLCDAYEGTV